MSAPNRILTIDALIGLLVARCSPAEMRVVEGACFNYPGQLADAMNRMPKTVGGDAEVVKMFLALCRTMTRSNGAGAS